VKKVDLRMKIVGALEKMPMTAWDIKNRLNANIQVINRELERMVRLGVVERIEFKDEAVFQLTKAKFYRLPERNNLKNLTVKDFAR